MFRLINRIVRTLIVFTIGSFILLFSAFAWFVVGIHSDSQLTTPRLAFWMEHDWVTGTSKDFYYLAEKVKEYGVTDLYFHVGPIESDGSLASDLNIFTPGFEALGTTNYAWIGQVRSQIDLDDPEVRAQIIKASQWVLDQGFDGIHVDIEPVKHEDTSFVDLLVEMKEELPETTKISVAMDEWQPHMLSIMLGNYLDQKIESYWTSDQVRAVSEYVDQIVVMTYDTKFSDGALYSWWVEQQTIALSKLIPEEGVELFIGIPSYETGEGIDPEAENVETGVRGFYQGLTNLRSKWEKISGIAIYSYWEMDSDEWVDLQVVK